VGETGHNLPHEVDQGIRAQNKGPGKKHTAREINLSIASLSNTPQRVQIFVHPTLSARGNGTLYELRGKTKPFANSFVTALDNEFRVFGSPLYLAYVPFRMNIRVPSAFL